MAKQNGNKSNLFKDVALGVALVIALGASGTAIGMGIAKNDWFKSDKQEESLDDTAFEEGGASIGTVTERGIQLMSAGVSSDEYVTYGISPLAESAYTLTATVNPSYASNQNVTWSVAWKDATSTFATGKTVTEYVKVTPTAEGAKTATVECLQAFGEQIIVTVASESNPDVTASATMDYAKRLTDLAFEVNYDSNYAYLAGDTLFGFNVRIEDDITIEYNSPMWGVGTVDDEVQSFSVLISVNETILETINNTCGYTFAAQDEINYGDSGYRLAELLYFDGKPVDETESALEALNAYLYENPETELFNIRFVIGCEYSTFATEAVGLYLMEDAVFVNVKSITLDQTGFIF